MILTSIALFVFGAIIASFVGVIVARLNTGQGFLTGRSHCDVCGTPLTPLVLVPILSYLFFNRRARCCGARLSFFAPLTEILLGGLFALAYVNIGLTTGLFFFLIALSALLALVLYDLMHQILPPVFLTVFVGASFVSSLLLSTSCAEFTTTLLVAFLIALFLALIHFFSRGRAMGLADTPLVFGLALLVGSAAFPGLVFSFWIGAVIGIGILLKRPAGSRMGVEVPFAPYLAAGFLLAYFTQWNPFILAAVLP